MTQPTDGRCSRYHAAPVERCALKDRHPGPCQRPSPMADDADPRRAAEARRNAIAAMEKAGTYDPS